MTRQPEAAGDGSVIRARPADTDALSRVIAEAFRDLAPSRWLIPDVAVRRAIFPGYFRLYVEQAMTSGVVLTTPGRDAVALWIPVGETMPGPLDGHAARLAAATAPWTVRFLAFDDALDRHHPAGVPHHHLAIQAVRPGRQGQGTGTALLRAYHRRLDQDLNAPAYLEASSERSRELYLRHGYADHGQPIHLPDGGPDMWPMWREPGRRPARTARSGRAPAR